MYSYIKKITCNVYLCKNAIHAMYSPRVPFEVAGLCFARHCEENNEK